MTNPTTPAIGDELSDELGFRIESRAGIDVLVYRNESCRPATPAEVDMWKAIAADRAARPATGVPAGMWLAPMEADVGMLIAFNEGERYGFRTFGDRYAAMRDSWLSRHPSPNGEDREVERDSERLDWLDSNNCTSVFKIGDRWYTRAGYQQPHHRARSLRAAIDAARAAGGEEQK